MNQYSNNRSGNNRGRSSNRAGSGAPRSSSGNRQYSSSYGGGRRNGRRKKHQKEQMIKLAAGGALLIVAVACITLAVKGVAGGKKEDPDVSTAATDIAVNTALVHDVVVDGVTIKAGTTFENVEKEILKQYDWDMKVTYQNDQYEIGNPLEERVQLLVKEIFEAEKNAKTTSSESGKESGEPSSEAAKQYQLDVSGLDTDLQKDVEAMAAKWDKKAKNGRIDKFDKETNKFLYAGEEKGVEIDQKKLMADIKAALDKKDFKATIKAVGNEVDPEITEAKAKEMYKVVGQYTTTTTSNSDRNTNVRLATEALDGMIIQPGEEFSFNKTTGNRTTEKGYRPAGAYVNGLLVEEPGGGVCQVSSTLYNAVVFSGLDVLERHPHSYEPSYVTPGEDAMVSYDGHTGPDMRFRNNSPSAVAIRGSFSDRKLTISIVAIPILEDGVKISMSSKKTSETEPPAAPTYEENNTLQPGQEVQVKAPTKGSVWETKVIKTVNGKEEVIDTYTSRYRGKGATIQRNTSGTVVTTVDPNATLPTEESTAPIESSSAEPTSPAGPTVEGPGGRPAEPSSSAAAPSGDAGGPGSAGPGAETPSTEVNIAPNPLSETTGGAGPG